jgi:hypothetical protein
MDNKNENIIINEKREQNQNEKNITDNGDKLFERICHIQNLIKKEAAMNSICNSILILFSIVLYSY